MPLFANAFSFGCWLAFEDFRGISGLLLSMMLMPSEILGLGNSCAPIAFGPWENGAKLEERPITLPPRE